MDDRKVCSCGHVFIAHGVVINPDGSWGGECAAPGPSEDHPDCQGSCIGGSTSRELERYLRALKRRATADMFESV